MCTGSLHSDYDLHNYIVAVCSLCVLHVYSHSEVHSYNHLNKQNSIPASGIFNSIFLIIKALPNRGKCKYLIYPPEHCSPNSIFLFRLVNCTSSNSVLDLFFFTIPVTETLAPNNYFPTFDSRFGIWWYKVK